MILTKENRATRFSIRATSKQKNLIARAANSVNKTISEFVLENAVEAAEALELDNANFVVSPDKYKAFLAALDEPPRSIPASANFFPNERCWMNHKYGAVKPLDKSQGRTSFDCGIELLNEYLRRYALQNQKRDAVRTYVVTVEPDRIVGYYTLVFGSVDQEEASAEVAQGLGKYSIPIILLARLAIDVSEKGKGLGKALMRDALMRSISASEIAGLRAVLVHAKDEGAKNFYQKLGFRSAPHNEFHLCMKISDIRASLAEGKASN